MILKIGKILPRILMYIFLFALLAFSTIPLLQVFVNSFRTNADVLRRPFGLPAQWVFNNWRETWVVGDYGTALMNSFIIASVVIVLVLIVVGLAAYAMSKLEFRGREFFIGYFFVAIALPGFLSMVPIFFLFNNIGLINTRASLMILYTAWQIPFNMLLLRTFLGGIPREIEEAAKIDGCSELQAFIHITVPIAKSIFMTIAILVFVNVWNEFLLANTFIMSDHLRPASTRFVRFIGEFSRDMARIYTGAAITTLPIIVMYLLFSRRFIEGMSSGSVKG